MSTKIRVATISSEADDWDDPVFEDEDFNKIKRRGSLDGEKRKKIDSFLEERRMKQHSVHDYSFDKMNT